MGAGSTKLWKREQEPAPKNGREQGERGKMSKGARNIDPPLTEPHKRKCLNYGQTLIRNRNSVSFEIALKISIKVINHGIFRNLKAFLYGKEH